MNEREKNRGEFAEVDLGHVLDALLHRSWIVLLVSILCAAMVFAGTMFFVTPEYEASAKFYVNNSSFSVGEASVSITSGDITASKSLVNLYIVILDTRETLNEVIGHSGVNRSYRELQNMIRAESVSETEVFQVTVTSTDPLEAEKIAGAICEVLPQRISSIVESTSAKVVESAVVPSRPSSPNYTMNTMLGFLIGFVLSAGIIVISVIFDTTIRSEEDIKQICKYPVLASVPDMNVPSKGGYYYGYGNNNRRKKKSDAGKESVSVIGSDISFAAAEAYKLLRTKLRYSFADEKNCRVIGVSSAMTGEGKSLTAVNLTIALAQLNQKVLLIDCDMRRPSLATKLNLQKTPGLSGFLSGQKQMNTLIQPYVIKGSQQAFHVITAGENPPNPVELLSSARMSRMINLLHEPYDYIILDLPPVSEVTDALAISKETDGILLVVRENYCHRGFLGDTVQQFEFVGARILGIAYNCTSEDSGHYGKSYYGKRYRRYYKRYYHKNGHTNADAAENGMEIPIIEV